MADAESCRPSYTACNAACADRGVQPLRRLVRDSGRRKPRGASLDSSRLVSRFGILTWLSLYTVALQNMCPHKRTIALSRGLVGDKAGATPPRPFAQTPFKCTFI